MDESRERRLAFNEALARDVNELVEEVSSSWFEPEERIRFRCECVRPECREPVELTRDEYESVRDHTRRFVVVAGHELLEVERVVAHLREYPVVEKIGPGAEVSEETDPRG